MPLPWSEIWTLIWRTVVLWAVSLAVFRLMGKRTLAKMGAFDFAVIIMIGEANALGIEDIKVSIFNPIAVILALGALQWALTYLNMNFRPLEILTQGTEAQLVNQGRINESALRRERVSHPDLMMELRQQGMTSLTDIDAAYLEPTGKLSIIKMKKPPSSPAQSPSGSGSTG